jgi:hypothetical protein
MMRPSGPGVGVGKGVNCAFGAAETEGMALIINPTSTTSAKPAMYADSVFLAMYEIILEELIAALDRN